MEFEEESSYWLSKSLSTYSSCIYSVPRSHHTTMHKFTLNLMHVAALIIVALLAMAYHLHYRQSMTSNYLRVFHSLGTASDSLLQHQNPRNHNGEALESVK